MIFLDEYCTFPQYYSNSLPGIKTSYNFSRWYFRGPHKLGGGYIVEMGVNIVKMLPDSANTQKANKNKAKPTKISMN